VRPARTAFLGLVAVCGLIATQAVAADRAGLAADPIDRSLLYSCGSTPFALSAFQGPANAQKAKKPWAKALRRLIAHPKFFVPPGRRWRLLVKTKQFVQYASGKPAEGISWLELQHRKRGGWDFSGSAFGCVPEAWAPDVGSATWWVDTSSPVNSSSTSFTAQVLEHSCASGRSPEGRIVEPRIQYGATQIIVTFFVRFAPGNFQTCEGNPSGPYQVQLAQPLGARVLMDGGVFPFRQRFPVLAKRR
jgi:hypothetical protein